ncbi:hypothetical protein AgCh_039271 [Apium graveolens]
MVLSATTPRFQPSNMSIRYLIPIRNLNTRLIQSTATVIFDLNVICTLLNYVTQNIILILKVQRSIQEYPSYLDWITFAAAIISTIGTISSLIKNKNTPPHKALWFNVLVSVLLVASTGHALAVHTDPKVRANIISNLLLYVTKVNSSYKERYYLLGDRKVPIAGFCVQGDEITGVAVSADDAHLINPQYQVGRNVALSVSGGEGLETDLNMREELY